MTLRYSPVNWLIVDWNFATCGLPRPDPCATPTTTTTEAVCKPLPIVIQPDTYDWARFLPNMQEGLEDPDDDICADRVREAAIDFATQSWVLQREISFVLQKDVTFYPLTPFPGERIVGAIAVKQNDQGCTPCRGTTGMTHLGVEFDVRQNGVHISSDLGCLCRNVNQVVSVLVYVAPTEDACAYDALLYDNYRAVITAEARRRYVRSHYYKDRALLQAQTTQQEFERAAINAKRRSVKPSTQDAGQHTGALFAGNSCGIARGHIEFNTCHTGRC
jgi:hypothetical protein